MKRRLEQGVSSFFSKRSKFDKQEEAASADPLKAVSSETTETASKTETLLSSDLLKFSDPIDCETPEVTSSTYFYLIRSGDKFCLRAFPKKTFEVLYADPLSKQENYWPVDIFPAIKNEENSSHRNVLFPNNELLTGTLSLEDIQKLFKLDSAGVLSLRGGQDDKSALVDLNKIPQKEFKKAPLAQQAATNIIPHQQIVDMVNEIMNMVMPMPGLRQYDEGRHGIATYRRTHATHGNTTRVRYSIFIPHPNLFNLPSLFSSRRPNPNLIPQDIDENLNGIDESVNNISEEASNYDYDSDTAPRGGPR